MKQVWEVVEVLEDGEVVPSLLGPPEPPQPPQPPQRVFMATTVTTAGRPADRESTAWTGLVEWVKAHKRWSAYAGVILLIAAGLFGWSLLSSRTAAIRSMTPAYADQRSEEHTSELQSPVHLVCRLLL